MYLSRWRELFCIFRIFPVKVDRLKEKGGIWDIIWKNTHIQIKLRYIFKNKYLYTFIRKRNRELKRHVENGSKFNVVQFNIYVKMNIVYQYPLDSLCLETAWEYLVIYGARLFSIFVEKVIHINFYSLWFWYIRILTY